MDAARQVVRWSIPGTVYILIVGVMQAAFRRGWYGPTHVGLAEGAATALLGLGASLPIGFVIFQIYYSRYRPLVLGARYVSRDRGNEVLSPLIDAGRVGEHIASR